MKIIQIRGYNGSGKTSTIKTLLASKQVEVRRFLGKNITVFDGDKCVLGDYTKSGCVGTDSEVYDKHELFDIVFDLAEAFDVVIFESAFYGKTFDLSKRIANKSRKIGAEYIGVYYRASVERAITNVLHRNGGKSINPANFYSGIRCTELAYRKLRNDGERMICFESDSLSIEEMADKLSGIIYGEQ